MIAVIGLLNDRPYEIFTGLADEDDGLLLPKVTSGTVIKATDQEGNKRYDFTLEIEEATKLQLRDSTECLILNIGTMQN